MRVLHVISTIDAQAGGTTSALVTLATSQAAAGLGVTVVSTFTRADDISPADAMRSAGVTVELIGPATGKLRRHPTLQQRIQRLVEQADIVHIHTLWEEILHVAARTAAKLNRRYLFTPHGMLDPWSLSQSKWVKKIYLTWRLSKDLNHAAAIHFTSQIERDLVRTLKLKPRELIVPNGLDLSEFQHLPPRGTFRQKFNLDDRPIILFLSRLHPKKGLDQLIPAFARASLPHPILVIAGPSSPDYQRQLEQQIRDLHLGNRVVFTGMLRGRERIEAFVAADLFVLPSRQENFGIVVVEAAAAGCPLLISDQVNIHREVASAGVGRVCRLGVDSVASELVHMMNDPALRAEVARRGPIWAAQHFDHHVIAQQWKSIYNEMLGNSVPQPRGR
ncbi:MAG TPA: glycosyltransferase [Tepidisphaeraceae bacterium]|jgi:glycosyltransferase involved in cell wall biosynthesis